MLATWSYKDRDMVIQRLDPRSRVIFLFCATLATVLIWDLRLLLILFGLALAQLLLARLTWRELRRFWIAAGLFIIFTTMLTLLTGRGGAGVYTIEHPIWRGRLLGLEYLV